ncbi:glycosyltransferase family 4 protein [Algoriphagus aquimarinus]|uniref:Glycosyltransferase n=1 Tax=Algoriphagus aquimarinus TaxID=237018 RepID=A0A5C7A8Z3_9BACT|nr:glycosyltransferase family 4 protein [Algoriphagus aquimarinus]TXE02132.1 glycosyltransferase [Algoriphagus aquimarinus]
MKELKILHIVAGNLNGGAAKGAYWQHQGLLEIGVNSRILINSRDALKDESVLSIITGKKALVKQVINTQLDLLPLKLYPNYQGGNFSVGIIGHDITTHEWYKWADVINLHWINGGFISIKGIAKINKPIVWTIRDMWPFTGGCHYSLGCENYKTGCGSCIQLGSEKGNDLSNRINISKQKKFPKSMKLVGISNWISQQARESSVFKNFDIRTIFNNIKCSDFYPIDKKFAREVLGLPINKKIILIGAQNINDFYKGFDKYLGAIKLLDKEKYFLTFFGDFDDSLVENFGFDYKKFGFLNDLISLRLLYSSADVFVAPSIMDAFGKTIAESMACGTPVVCFDSTGPKDIVDHKINGYKAKPYKIEDLKEGILWVLNNEDNSQLSLNAKNKIQSTFDFKVIASQYVKLYEECLIVN